MAIFLVSPISEPNLLAKAIKDQFPDDYYEIPKTHNMFVHFRGTVRELSDKLGVSSGESGTAVIVTVANYHGRAPVDIWEWIQSRSERD